jgi:uncharacterized protein (TIGR02246 family)
VETLGRKAFRPVNAYSGELTVKLTRLVAATCLACIGIALLGCAALLAPALADEKADRAKDEAAIKQLGKDWQKAWNKHDMDALALLFAEDADFVTVGGRWLKGRKAFKEHHDKKHAMQFKESVFTTAEVQVKFLKPDIALVHVNWSMKGDKDPDGTPRQPRSGLFTWVVTNQGGDWLIQAAHNTGIVAF